MSIDRWKDKEVVIHIHIGILLSHKKEHIWVSSEVDEPRAYYTQWSQEEKSEYHILTNIWNLERWYWWTCMWGSNGNTHIVNRLVDTVGEGEDGMNWESSIETYTFSSVQFSCSVMSDSLRPHESQHTRPPCPSPAPGVHSDSSPSSRWCHPAISSSVIPFSSCPQLLPASGSFPMSQLFAWGGQSTGVSALESFPPKKSQDWSPLEWTGWISLQSKGLSRVFSKTTFQKHQFFGAQLSSQSNSHIHTWPLEKP